MKILLVDDDPKLVTSLSRVLREAGLDVDTATDGAGALDKLDGIDLVVTDVRMPGMDGLELMHRIREERPRTEVIVMTAFGTIPHAIEAMRAGARAYLTKPFDSEELVMHVREVQKLMSLWETAAGRGQLMGSSARMQAVYQDIDVATASTAAVLITGKTGTGKELAARAIHSLSSRRNGPFIAVNLGAMPKDLVEGELFGHEKGAFTGAGTKQKGRFVLANGGTILLDEIDSFPLNFQPKLLRAIEESAVWPLGAQSAQKVNVRIIAATNANIEELVQSKDFRDDLYFRLNVLRVNMPPLCEHAEDIPQIVGALLKRMNSKTTGRPVEISRDVLSRMILQSWPGNVRELSNVLERAAARATAMLSSEPNGPILIGTEHMDVAPLGSGDLPFKDAKIRVADDWAKTTIQSALIRFGDNATHAAKALKMSRTALLRLINRYGIQRHSTEDMPQYEGR